jgi:hypothetical protein
MSFGVQILNIVHCDAAPAPAIKIMRL